MRYFEIKTFDIERVDIEGSEGVVRDTWMAATAWEVEAERRREVLDADARRFDVPDRARKVESGSGGGRLWSLLRGSPSQTVSQHGKLDEKHA